MLGRMAYHKPGAHHRGLFEGLPIGATVEKEDIIRNIKEQYSDKEVDEVFESALRQGVLDERLGGAFTILIPSMQRWLVDVHGKGKSLG